VRLDETLAVHVSGQHQFREGGAASSLMIMPDSVCAREWWDLVNGDAIGLHPNWIASETVAAQT